MSRGSKRWTMQSDIKCQPPEFRVVDIGDGRPVKVEVCQMCGVAPSNVDDCGEFGNPECPCFGIGIEEYEARFGKCDQEAAVEALDITEIRELLLILRRKIGGSLWSLDDEEEELAVRTEKAIDAIAAIHQGILDNCRAGQPVDSGERATIGRGHPNLRRRQGDE